jgi:hypothetical protein
MIFGRTEGDQRYPKDRAMSTQHCRVHVARNDVYVEDLKSTNGTKVNAVKIEPARRRRIQLDDVIVVGRRRFILTNQDRYAPAHAETTRWSKVLGGRTLGGSLTGGLSKVVTEKTGRILAKRELAEAKMEQFSSPRKWDFSTILLLLGALGFWVELLVRMIREGALAGGLIHGVAGLLGRYVLAAAGTTYVIVLAHYLAANVVFRKAGARVVLILVSGVAFWALAAGADSLLGLGVAARENVALRECMRRQPAESCLKDVAGRGRRGSF